MNADTYLLEPAARGYQSNVPDAGRKAIDNHLNWAGMPSTALNSTFQAIMKMQHLQQYILR